MRPTSAVFSRRQLVVRFARERLLVMRSDDGKVAKERTRSGSRPFARSTGPAPVSPDRNFMAQ
jgi:hypothetical protein